MGSSHLQRAFENEFGNPWLPLAATIAREWAKEYNYPLEDSSQLAKVSLFMGIMRNNELYAKMELGDNLSKISPPDFLDKKYENIPHVVLADLNRGTVS